MEVETKKKVRKSKKGKRRRTITDGAEISGREFALERTLLENETKSNSFRIYELDSMVVISKLQKDGESLQQQLDEAKITVSSCSATVESVKTQADHRGFVQLEEMNNTLMEKDMAYKLIQQELVVIKEFRLKRQALLQELESSKVQMIASESKHQQELSGLERKYLEDKMQDQKETTLRMGELASKAHSKAVIGLDGVTKETFKQNIQMSSALLIHIAEGVNLRSQNLVLSKRNSQLEDEYEFNIVMIKDRMVKLKVQQLEGDKQKNRILTLESSLTILAQEYENTKITLGNQAKAELYQIKKIVTDLSARLHNKTEEIRHIKRLAQHLLDQRTEIEVFFMDALETVKSKMKSEKSAKVRLERLKYQQPAKKAQSKLKPLDTIDSNENIDIKDISWEDKEKILRIVFGKVNGVSLANDHKERKDTIERRFGVRSGIKKRGSTDVPNVPNPIAKLSADGSNNG